MVKWKGVNNSTIEYTISVWVLIYTDKHNVLPMYVASFGVKWPFWGGHLTPVGGVIWCNCNCNCHCHSEEENNNKSCRFYVTFYWWGLNHWRFPNVEALYHQANEHSLFSFQKNWRNENEHLLDKSRLYSYKYRVTDYANCNSFFLFFSSKSFSVM